MVKQNYDMHIIFLFVCKFTNFKIWKKKKTYIITLGYCDTKKENACKFIIQNSSNVCVPVVSRVSVTRPNTVPQKVNIVQGKPINNSLIYLTRRSWIDSKEVARSSYCIHILSMYQCTCGPVTLYWTQHGQKCEMQKN